MSDRVILLVVICLLVVATVLYNLSLSAPCSDVQTFSYQM